MTDRHAGYIVTLTDDMREDDAEYILNAIRMIKGVAAVGPIVSTAALQVAEQRRDGIWRDALLSLADEGPE